MDVARDAEQRAEGVEGIEATVEAEGEFVEIGLQVLLADAVMNAAKPGFEIGEHEVNDGQKGFRDLYVASLGDGSMKKSTFSERRIAAPVIGDNGGAWRNGMLDETDQRLGASVRHHREPDAPSVTPSLSLVEAAGTFALAYFDGTRHDDHIVNAAAFAPRATAHVGFIGFHDDIRLAADLVLIRSHHTGAELVKNLKRRFVARKPELALKLDSRHAGCLAGDEVRSPEPDRKRCVGALHDSACRESGFASAMPTAKDAKAGAVSVRLAGRITVGAHETVTPSRPLKVGRARSLIWKQLLKLRQRAWERQIVSLKYVDNHNCSTLAQILNILPIVGVCDNRISTENTLQDRYVFFERAFRW